MEVRAFWCSEQGRCPMHPNRLNLRQATYQRTRTHVSRNKRTKRRNGWPIKLREFSGLLAVIILVAIRVLVLLLILMAIGIVANAIGSTFHLVHSAIVANHVVGKFWDELW